MVLSEDGTTFDARDFLAPDTLTLAWNWSRNVRHAWTCKRSRVKLQLCKQQFQRNNWEAFLVLKWELSQAQG